MFGLDFQLYDINNFGNKKKKNYYKDCVPDSQLVEISIALPKLRESTFETIL